MAKKNSLKNKINNIFTFFRNDKSETNVKYFKNDKIIEAPDYLLVSAHKQLDVRNEEPFASIAKKAVLSKKTFLYYDRLYTLYNVVKSVQRCKGTSSFHAIEVGVYKGGASVFLAEILIKLGIQFPQIDCFDTFSGHDNNDLKSGKDRLEIHNETVFKDTSFESVSELLRPFPFVNCHKGRFQDKCNLLENQTIDFVHLDVDIYLPTLHALEFVFPRLTIGGCIVVDDYRYDTCPGAKDAVDNFIKTQTNCFCLPLFTGQFILAKLAK